MTKKDVMKEIVRLAGYQRSRALINPEKILEMIEKFDENDFSFREKVLADRFVVSCSHISCELRESVKKSAIFFTIRTNETSYRGECHKNEEEVRTFYENERKKIIMKRIAMVSFSPSFSLDEFEKAIENFDGGVNLGMTREGFKLWFENKDGVEFYCELREPLKFPGIFYTIHIKSDTPISDSDKCTHLDTEARRIYDMVMEKLLS